MEFKVEMLYPGVFLRHRMVTVPDNELSGDVLMDLSKIFSYGQNDLQLQSQRSVSVGDIIQYNGERYLVENVGFSKLVHP